MGQTSNIYWENVDTAERARLMAQAENMSLSKLVSTLVNEKYAQEFPEPPILTICPTCREHTTFVFVAYWEEQSDLYRCVLCRTALQKDTILELSPPQQAPQLVAE